jgi:hypothetical protein
MSANAARRRAGSATLAEPLPRPELAFALIYYAIFLAIGHSGWWLGAIFGLGHGLFSGTALAVEANRMLLPRSGNQGRRRTMGE